MAGPVDLEIFVPRNSAVGVISFFESLTLPSSSTASLSAGWGGSGLEVAVDLDGDGIAEWTIQPSYELTVRLDGHHIYMPQIMK